MSDLGFNKIAGAVLATGLAVVGLNQLSKIIYEPELAQKEGYHIEVVEAADAGGAKEELPPDWGTVLPAADVSAGQAVFAKCSSCHKPTDENSTGPGLNGVVGRKPGTHAGFAYSAAMVAHGNEKPVWDYAELDAFLKAPQKHVQGTKMTFAGLKKQEDRINVIAYLHTLNSSLPIPAPNPAAAAAAAAPAEGAAPAGAEAGKPTSTGSTAQAGQPGQTPSTGAAQAPSATNPTGKTDHP